MSAAPEHDGLAARLRRRRRLARAALLFEQVWPAVWPALGLIGAFLCAALLDLPAFLPGWIHAALLAALVLAVVSAFFRGLRHVRLPGPAEADRRLETATGLAHRPLAALADRPALPGAEALWLAHLARARAQITRLRVGWPHPGLAARDPRALRALLIVALFSSVVIAGDDAGPRLLRALQPRFAPVAAVPAAQLQAWITPPGFTGMAPVFLKTNAAAAAAAADISVPAGSHLTVSVTGGSGGAPSLALGGQTTPFKTLDALSFQAEQDLTAGGRLSVSRDGSELGAWNLTVVADRAPLVTFPSPPSGTRGRVPQTRLPWQVSHDYGVVSLQAELHLRDRPNAPALIVNIPLPGGAPKAAKGVRQEDLTANPWAGLPVTARLLARDAGGLTGHSQDEIFTLPERRFDNPVARALLAVRKALSLDPDARQPAVTELDRLSALPDVWTNDAGAFLNLRAIASLLRDDGDQAGADQAQSRLWQLALHLEEGAGARTAQALDQARQALRDALDAQQRGAKVDPKELDRLMKNLQDALQRHLDALAQQLRRDPDAQPLDPNSQALNSRDMQDLAEKMREDAEQGRMDDARQDMAELEQMLNALQNARPPGPMTPQQRQRAAQRQRGRQQMSVLQDLVRREGGLLDPAQARAQSANGGTGFSDNGGVEFPGNEDNGQFGNFGGTPHLGRDMPSGPPPDSPATQPAQQSASQTASQSATRAGEQRIQQALRLALGELMQQYGDLTGQVPQNLGDADGAMHDAIQSLASSDDSGAASSEQQAIAALEKGGQSMSQQMAMQFGLSAQEQQGEDEGDEPGDMSEGNPNGDQQGDDGFGPDGQRRRGQLSQGDERGPRDPLGRPIQEGSAGREDSDGTVVPDKMEATRSRELQDELRRRDAERARPQIERDYIGRLLAPD